MTRRLFCFGLGYTGLALARRLRDAGWRVGGTCRAPDKAALLRAEGVEAVVWNEDQGLAPAALAGATHLLATIPPGPQGDPVLAVLRRLAGGGALAAVRWAGYLSTTGVYGDHAGGWVDEETPLNPGSARARARVTAEAGWTALGLPLHIFRLPGIYGPGRSAIDQLRAGAARRIDKPGQVFSRIHVDDIVGVLEASIARPRPGAVYNVADDLPCPSPEVVAYAAGLLGVGVPPLLPFDKATLSPMAASFYAENRRVGNARIKRELGVRLRYPTYREGLAAQMAAG